jgi:type I restriction enzyme S subunit
VTDLPSGWASGAIADLIGQEGAFVDGDWVETKDQDPGGDVRLTQLADIGEGRFRDRSHRFLTSLAATRLRCTYLEQGDILVARMPDPLGRACIFLGDLRPCVTAVDVCIIRPGANTVDSRWLMWWINTPQFRSEILARQAGTTRKRISRKNLSAIKFPIPPLEEQRRIVAAIEEQLSRLDAAERSLIQARHKLVALRGASLAAATAHHQPVELGEVLTDLRYGTSMKCAYEPQGPPVLRIPNVKDGRVDIADLKYAADPDADLSAFSLDAGDLLFVRTNGSRDLIGRVASVAGTDGMAFASYLIRARPDRSRLEPRFAVLALSAPGLRARIAAKAATTAGQYNLNLSALRSLPLPLPPLDEQRRIVASVERVLSVVDVLGAQADIALRRSAVLRRSILERAFAGELVAQDPNDEPAATLLERIARTRHAPERSLRRNRRVAV